MSKIHSTLPLPNGRLLEVAAGDITLETVDAIVNAANEHLAHGGGVAAAIVRRGGEVIQKQSNRWVRQHGPVTHADPAYTGAGSLPCRYVIHAVGPVWGEGDEDRKLADAIYGSLRLANWLGLSSLAFPAISTGIFGFPKARAVPIFLDVIETYFKGTPDSSLQLIRITLMDLEMLDLFTNAIEARLNPKSDPGHEG